MRKGKPFGILALAAIVAALAFTACPPPDDGGGDPPPETPDNSVDGAGSLGSTVNKTYSGVVDIDGNPCTEGGISFDKVPDTTTSTSPYLSFSDIFENASNAEVRLSALGTLTVKLPAVKADKLQAASALSVGMNATTITDGLKIFSISTFTNDSNQQIYWGWEDVTHTKRANVSFFYANKDGWFKGNMTNPGMTVTYNIGLKTGWNTVVIRIDETTDPVTSDTTYTLTATSAVPDASFKWIFID
jgi:hypothetical protein